MNRRIAITTMVLAAAATGSVAFAGDDLTSLSYISYLERYATVRPGQGGETLDAVVNMPVLAGDRLDTARGARVELQLSDGSTVWVDEFTTIDFDALAYSRESSAPRTALFLSDDGGIAVEIPSTALGSGSLRVDTRAGTIFLNRPGFYRVSAKSGELGVEVHLGLAELPEGYGSTLLRAGQQAWLDDDGDIDKAVLEEDFDDFWSWVQERQHPASNGRTGQYVDSGHGGRAAVLDSYGEWVYISSYSTYMWRPRVSMTWTPYSSGRWVWTPVGWTWVAYEPWGWYPYHYGSWYWDASVGWAWSWDRIWGPAWVHWVSWDGYVGWCPRGYYDYWYWNRHGGNWNNGHGGTSRPGRWSDVTLDFRGRVRLREIDSRPWTFVAADRFTDSHLDRVRLDPSRLLRDLPGDRYGDVRSGPLVTPSPGRLGPSRTIEDAFRRQDGERPVPELSDILRRQEGAQRNTGETPFRSVRTGDVARDSRPVGNGGGTLRDVERPVDRDRVGVPDRSPNREGWERRDPGSSGGSDRGVRRSEPSSPPTREVTRPSDRTPSRRVEREASPRVAPPTRSDPGTTREAPPPAKEVSPPVRSEPTTSREVPRSQPAPPPSRSDRNRSFERPRDAASSPIATRSQVDRREVAASRRIEAAPRTEPRSSSREARAWSPPSSRISSGSRPGSRASGGSGSRSGIAAPRAYAPPSRGSSSSSRSAGSSIRSSTARSGSTRPSGSSSARSSGSGSPRSTGSGSSRSSGSASARSSGSRSSRR